MKYEEFKTTLLEELNKAAEGNEYISSFIPSSTMKNNDYPMDSIMPEYNEHKGVCPCIHPEELYEDYENGRSMEEIVNYVINQTEYTYTHSPQFKLGDLTSDEVKSNLYLQLVNGETNSMIKDNCASFPVNDLMAVPRCKVEIDGMEGSFLVNHQIQAEMKLTDDELLNIARVNTLKQSYSLRTMSEVLSESLGIEIPFNGPDFLVLSSENGVNGSIHMINPDAMSEAAERFDNENLYIIPSSTEEILILPESFVEDPASLQEVCQEINSNTEVVKETQVLSNNIYRFDSQTQKISICNNLQDLNTLKNPPQIQTQTNTHRQAM